MKLRFRDALRPAQLATAFGEVRDAPEGGGLRLALTLRAGDKDLVTATATTIGG